MFTYRNKVHIYVLIERTENALLKLVQKEYIPKPAGTDFVHASTNLRLQNGTVLLSWFGGSKEGNDDVSIYYSLKKDAAWSLPVKLDDGINEPHWNPVLFPLDNQKIMLFYKVGKEITKWRTYYCFSLDGGTTFTAPKELVQGDKGGRGPVRNKPIRLSNGDMAAPASMENGIWHAFVDLSSDNGKTWKPSNNIVIENITYSQEEIVISESKKKIPVSEQSFFGRGVIQPSLWESDPGSVHMLLRSSEGAVYRSDSLDYGKTWSKAYVTDLPNNNSGLDLVKLNNGVLVLIYNPVGTNWGPRSPISLALSQNNGKTWQKLMNLDSGEGEFSYPAITASEDRIFISYSYKRESIAFWELEIQQEQADGTPSVLK